MTKMHIEARRRKTGPSLTASPTPVSLSRLIEDPAAPLLLRTPALRPRPRPASPAHNKGGVVLFGWVFFLVSLGGQAPHVQRTPMGVHRTCGGPNGSGLTPIEVKLNGSWRVPLVPVPVTYRPAFLKLPSQTGTLSGTCAGWRQAGAAGRTRRSTVVFSTPVCARGAGGRMEQRRRCRQPIALNHPRSPRKEGVPYCATDGVDIALAANPVRPIPPHVAAAACWAWASAWAWRFARGSRCVLGVAAAACWGLGFGVGVGVCTWQPLRAGRGLGGGGGGLR